MADNSKIEWTDASWNPIRARNRITGKVGWHCEHATTGCEFCYAEGFNRRLGTGLPFKPGHRKDIEIFLDQDMLTQPLHWKKPRRIFVGSMTDLLADFVPDEWLFEIFAVMGACEDRSLGHEFQILTKRAARMRAWMTSTLAVRAWNQCRFGLYAWPPRNVWLGVSTERQQEADERIPLLLQTPAAVRFISAEPLLGPVDLTKIAAPKLAPDDEAEGWKFSCLDTGDYYTLWDEDPLGPGERCVDSGDGPYRETKLDWVIVGGESGPGARPMHPDWARSLRDECAAADVPFFFKQWGAYLPTDDIFATEDQDVCIEGQWMARVGKKGAGRLLDGVEHNAMPARGAA